MPSKNASIIWSSLTHMGLVWQQVEREQADGPCAVQETAAKLGISADEVVRLETEALAKLRTQV